MEYDYGTSGTVQCWPVCTVVGLSVGCACSALLMLVCTAREASLIYFYLYILAVSRDNGVHALEH